MHKPKRTLLAAGLSVIMAMALAAPVLTTNDFIRE